ncbi:MAG: hypothetical protein CMG46_02405 [Candidatus Marinimicrobia bacterium]|nr:hypothetical protein [Candidatus Neomarinimicrobiota bacterium]
MNILNKVFIIIIMGILSFILGINNYKEDFKIGSQGNVNEINKYVFIDTPITLYDYTGDEPTYNWNWSIKETLDTMKVTENYNKLFNTAVPVDSNNNPIIVDSDSINEDSIKYIPTVNDFHEYISKSLRKNKKDIELYVYKDDNEIQIDSELKSYLIYSTTSPHKGEECKSTDNTCGIYRLNKNVWNKSDDIQWINIHVPINKIRPSSSEMPLLIVKSKEKQQKQRTLNKVDTEEVRNEEQTKGKNIYNVDVVQLRNQFKYLDSTNISINQLGWYASNIDELKDPRFQFINRPAFFEYNKDDNNKDDVNTKMNNNIYFLNSFPNESFQNVKINEVNKFRDDISINQIQEYSKFPNQTTLEKMKRSLIQLINTVCFKKEVKQSNENNTDYKNKLTEISKEKEKGDQANQKTINQLLKEAKEIKEKGNEEMITKVPICYDIRAEVTMNTIDNVSNKIRENTINLFNLPSKEFNITNKPYLLGSEIELYFKQNRLIVDTDTSDDNIQMNLMDINNNQLNPEYFHLLTTEYMKNNQFKNCMDTLMGSDNNMMINSIKETPLDDWMDEHFTFIEDKIRTYLELSVYEIDGCLKLLSSINRYICNGEIIISVYTAIELFMDAFSGKTISGEINNTKGISKNLNRLIDIISYNMKLLLKKTIDISKYFESKYCNSITNVTNVIQKLYDRILNDESIINYNLFNNISFDTSFFDDFTTNIYGKTILLMCGLYLISKIL